MLVVTVYILTLRFSSHPAHLPGGEDQSYRLGLSGLFGMQRLQKGMDCSFSLCYWLQFPKEFFAILVIHIYMTIGSYSKQHLHYRSKGIIDDLPEQPRPHAPHSEPIRSS